MCTNSTKKGFSKSDTGPFGVHGQVPRAHFEPVLSHFGLFYHPSKALKTSHFVTKVGSKMGQKNFVPKLNKPFGVHNQVKLDCFLSLF